MVLVTVGFCASISMQANPLSSAEWDRMYLDRNSTYRVRFPDRNMAAFYHERVRVRTFEMLNNGPDRHPDWWARISQRADEDQRRTGRVNVREWDEFVSRYVRDELRSHGRGGVWQQIRDQSINETRARFNNAPVSRSYARKDFAKGEAEYLINFDDVLVAVHLHGAADRGNSADYRVMVLLADGQGKCLWASPVLKMRAGPRYDAPTAEKHDWEWYHVPGGILYDARQIVIIGDREGHPLTTVEEVAKVFGDARVIYRALEGDPSAIAQVVGKYVIRELMD